MFLSVSFGDQNNFNNQTHIFYPAFEYCLSLYLQDTMKYQSYLSRISASRSSVLQATVAKSCQLAVISAKNVIMKKFV